MTPKTTVVDFETEAIDRRPLYPPKPVGFSIKKPGDKASKYYAWGHPTENNCDFEQAQRVLKSVWNNDHELLFQNCKFDVDVAETHMGMPRLSWDKIHDTLYLLFLDNPHALSLSLKESAKRVLGIPPEERDVLKEWIVRNVPEANRKPSTWGAYICRAPGKLVGDYANGDVLRTDLLFRDLYPKIAEVDMIQAYDRERKLMPILLENEKIGIRVDYLLMEKEFAKYKNCLEIADHWLRNKLQTPGLNFNEPTSVAEALDKSGIVTQWVMTKTGRRSTAKKNMTLGMFEDEQAASVYGYRQRLDTCLSMFFEPWLEMARASGGRIYTEWNQVRQANERTAGLKGARTGRMSSSPNFMNVPKDFSENDDGFVHPDFIPQLIPLPKMRKYFLPDDNSSWWLKRDYNQQELRGLAHFEDGRLMNSYRTDPRLNGAPKEQWFDVHAMVKSGIFEIAHLDLHRRQVKIINFGDIYGMGVGELANKMKVDVITGRRVRIAKRALLPDLAQLDDGIKQRGRAGLPIRTWGGRLYYCEPPGFSKKFGREVSFEYKLLNYLIQGSCADCTKESIIRYHEHPRSGPNTGDGRFLVTVHDENNLSGKKKNHKHEMSVLREVMESIEFDVPMLSDGEIGPSWGNLKDYKD